MRPAGSAGLRQRAARRLPVVVLAGAALGTGAVLGTSGALATAHPVCSQHPPQQIQSNPWPAARHRLAPAGPSTIDLCRYSGINSHPRSGLQGSRVIVDRSRIDALVARLDALKAFPNGQVFSCPADDGSQVLATLSYGDQHKVRISVGLGGCNSVTNGDVERSAANLDDQNPQGPKLLAQLKRLTRHQPG